MTVFVVSTINYIFTLSSKPIIRVLHTPARKKSITFQLKGRFAPPSGPIWDLSVIELHKVTRFTLKGTRVVPEVETSWVEFSSVLLVKNTPKLVFSHDLLYIFRWRHHSFHDKYFFLTPRITLDSNNLAEFWYRKFLWQLSIFRALFWFGPGFYRAPNFSLWTFAFKNVTRRTSLGIF